MRPSRLFLTSGTGIHRERLQSFELALRAAGIAICNLVEVSSIVPPGCDVISFEEGQEQLRAGEITFCVLAKNATRGVRNITAAVGMALPADHTLYGYLSEHHGEDETAAEAGDYAEDLAATMLATTLGIEFDPEQHWDERKQQYRMSGRIVHSRSVAAEATGTPGRWTTVLAAALFLE